MQTAVQLAEQRILLEELAQLEQILIQRENAEELKKCKADPWYFAQNYVYTPDEIDPYEPVKKYPDWEFLHDVFRVWNAYPEIRLIGAEKSRRMIFTVTFDLLFLWDAMFLDGRLNLITSQNEEKANRQIENRIWIMYTHLPDWMKAAIPARKIFGKLIVPGKDVSPKLDKKASSVIWSVPQENEQARGETASNYLYDEVAAMSEAEKNYMATMPAVEVGKRIGPRMILISTAGRGFFEKLIHDTL